MKYLSSILLFIIVAISCTNVQEDEAPESFGTNISELSYDTDSSLRPVIISSGTKWSVATMPSWISLESISSSSGSPYEWTANFAAEANDGYNREGRIVINAKDESAEITVTQEGKKGKYVAVEEVSLEHANISLEVGETTTLTYELFPSNASIKTVSWSSSIPNVASVDDTGKITAIAEGRTIITVRTEDWSRARTGIAFSFLLPGIGVMSSSIIRNPTDSTGLPPSLSLPQVSPGMWASVRVKSPGTTVTDTAVSPFVL